MSDGQGTRVYIVSDALGETAEQIARAAMTQFPQADFRVVRVPRVRSTEQLDHWMTDTCCQDCVIFYTLADPDLRQAMAAHVARLGLQAVDIMREPVAVLAGAGRTEPAWRSGGTMRPGRGSLQWFEALEFAFRHDDGKHADELSRAGIVLIGASRTSKTPLSMYLAFRGHAVGNVPIMAEIPPPPELFELDPMRVFGLMTEPELLMKIRAKRAAEMGRFGDQYAGRDAVKQDLEAARRVMREIGCRTVRTGDRAIEETAHEIIDHLEG